MSQIRAPIQVEARENLPREAMAVPAERGGALTKTTEAGNHLLTFELPEKCFVNELDMDKLPNLEGNISHAHVFSFRERLEGWNIERKQRENGTRCDVYYCHSKSKRMFRSASEVVNFMLYEIYPENPRKRKAPSSSSSGGVRKQEESHEEEMTFENEYEWFSSDVDYNAHFEKLENEAAEVLASMGDDGTANKGVFGGAANSSLDDEADLINHIPLCQSLEELQEFLIQNRKNMG